MNVKTRAKVNPSILLYSYIWILCPKVLSNIVKDGKNCDSLVVGTTLGTLLTGNKCLPNSALPVCLLTLTRWGSQNP